MNRFAIKALAAASLSLLAVAPAAAEEVRVTVRYGDLDIASPAGARILASRLQNGAETACVRPEIRDLKSLAAWEACKDAAISAALAQLAQQGAAIEGTSLAALY